MPQESPRREHIRRIRQEKFGLADDGTRLNENALAQDLGNALHRLSQDLYSNVHHFILELIQNAKDNDYANDDAKLIFELHSDDPTETPGSSGCLCVLNNETGFTDKNIASLCAVGQSTKSGQQGYIEEKGHKRGDDFWLYVVEHAMSESPPQPHCFKNPVASVTSYRFDKNWRQLLAAEDSLE